MSRDTNFVSNRQDLTNPSHNMWTAPKNEDDTAEVMRIITMVMHCRAVSGISFMQGEQHSGERGGQFIITSPLFQPRIGKRWNIEIKPKSSEVGGDQTKNTESEFWNMYTTRSTTPQQTRTFRDVGLGTLNTGTLLHFLH